MLFSPGDKLGPYEILAPLGAGGMGEVWKARDTRLNRMVAIKRQKRRQSARFLQEAHAIAALNHPHICQIYDVGPDYLVMEYVEGKPLAGPLRVEEAVKLALQIAAALEEAHGKGILHRDLKPSNILVTGKGIAKLLDFGLAKAMTDLSTDATQTLEGTIVGTAAYMAPEQAEGKPADERSDVFSFGAVLYEMLSGTRAFRGNSTATVMSAVLRDDPSLLEAPAELQRIVGKCLAKQPGNRFPSMEEVRLALEQIALEQAKPADQQPSIAILPFANLSADKENEYFSDGLAEEILNLLAKTPGLKVIARTSSFAFRGKEQDIRRIAETLGVSNVLEGSVRRAGNRLRITAQLIHAADGAHLWSERYDSDMTDVFAMQDEIAVAIAGALQVKLTMAPAALRRYTPQLPAYEAYLKGMHHYAKVTPESLAKAREYFEQAIVLDPGYALPHSALGMYFVNLGSYGMQPAHAVMPLARGAARKALEIDPLLPEAHAVLGVVAGIYDYDWEEAGRLFRLATSRDPISPMVHYSYGTYLTALGRTEEAIEEFRRALREDPLNLGSRMMLEVCLQTAGRLAEAVAEAHRILEFDENYFPAYFNLSLIDLSRGKLEEARAFAERACSLAPWDPMFSGHFAGLLMRTGDVKRAEAVLARFEDSRSCRVALGFVFYHLAQTQIDRASDWIEKAIDQRDPLLTLFLRLPFAAPLRSSARWPALEKMMNLPESATQPVRNRTQSISRSY